MSGHAGEAHRRPEDAFARSWLNRWLHLAQGEPLASLVATGTSSRHAAGWTCHDRLELDAHSSPSAM